MLRFTTCMLALFVGTDAFAITFVGNPKVQVTVSDPSGDLDSGTVELDAVTLHLCGGGSITYEVGQTIDPVAGWVSPSGLPSYDFCGLTVTWGDTMSLFGDNAGGSVEVEYSKASTFVTFSAPPVVALNPHTVVVGSLPGGGPSLALSLQ